MKKALILVLLLVFVFSSVTLAVTSRRRPGVETRKDFVAPVASPYAPRGKAVVDAPPRINLTLEKNDFSSLSYGKVDRTTGQIWLAAVGWDEADKMINMRAVTKSRYYRHEGQTETTTGRIIARVVYDVPDGSILVDHPSGSGVYGGLAIKKLTGGRVWSRLGYNYSDLTSGSGTEREFTVSSSTRTPAGTYYAESGLNVQCPAGRLIVVGGGIGDDPNSGVRVKRIEIGPELKP